MSRNQTNGHDNFLHVLVKCEILCNHHGNKMAAWNVCMQSARQLHFNYKDLECNKNEISSYRYL